MELDEWKIIFTPIAESLQDIARDLHSIAEKLKEEDNE